MGEREVSEEEEHRGTKPQREAENRYKTFFPVSVERKSNKMTLISGVLQRKASNDCNSAECGRVFSLER